MSEELKPCPFCGGDVGQNAYWDYWCTNPLCAIHHVAFRTKERWNTRTPDTELTRLKRQVEVLSEGFSKIADENNDDCVHCIANEALAAADRIAKEQPHDKD
jgi:hypothetical protein